MIRLFPLFVLCCFALPVHATELNLVANESLETLGDNNLPADWHVVTTWGPKGKFASDDREHHTGHRSIRISADENAQNYLATGPIAVSPGEVFHCSGWVKAKDVKTGENGKVQIQGVYFRENGNDDGETIAALKLSPDGSSDWTHLEGDFKIPAQSLKAWVRFGMHDASGTVWWDDLELHPENAIAARIDVKAQRVSPAAGGLNVTIINRDGRKDSVELTAQVGKQKGTATIALTGEPQQPAVVPMEFGEPGLVDCSIAIVDASRSDSYTQKRKVTVPPPLEVLPPIPTHWVKEDGPADISGQIDFEIPESQLSQATLTLDLVDASGRSIHNLKQTSGFALKDNRFDWQMKVGAVPLGDYKLIAKLTSKNGKTLTDEQAWHVINRADSKVVLNGNGYLEYKGKPIFPLGIFNCGGRIKEMSESGFTITHAYNAMDVVAGEPSPDQKPLTFLDQTQKAGMMCLFLVPRQYVFHHDWDAVRRRIRMFRNHPAMLAWDEEEGLARGDMKPDDLQTLVQIIREEDPNHPIMIGDSRDSIRKVTDRSNFFPVNEMDLGMWWWYPLPLGGGKPSALNGEEEGHGLELVPPTFLTQRKTDKPIWVGVQSYKKPQPWARFPTAVEYRAQAYISMISGAKGLMWYGGGVEGGIFGHPKDAHWDDLKALAKELHDMAPVFMAQTIEAPKFTPESSPISVMMKKLPDRTVLLAANRGSNAVDVTFTVSKPGHAKVLIENRSVNVQDGRLTDRFGPYVVHVYEFAR